MNDPALARRAGVSVGTLAPQKLDQLRTLSRILDSAVAIPGTRYRFGLDAVVGLVPGIGDAIGAIFSIYIIFQAARMGVPRITLARMIGNVAVDTLIGEIPILGDAFDVGFKSNIRNLTLIEQHVQRPSAAQSQSRQVLFLVGAGLLVLFVGIVALSVFVAELIVHSIR
jgi:Domain of unknown function (DUF4112)